VLTSFRVSAALIVAEASAAVLLLVVLAATHDAFAESTDTTPPVPPYIEEWNSGFYMREAGNKGTLLFNGGASELEGAVDLYEGQQKVGTDSTLSKDCDPAAGLGNNCSYYWFIELKGISEGTHTYYATHTDTAGNTSLPSKPCAVDVVVLPMVTSTFPAAGSTGVSREINVVANFSEHMDKGTLTKETFKLYKITATGPVPITNVIRYAKLLRHEGDPKPLRQS
jgi:Bacterial Ig-like domain